MLESIRCVAHIMIRNQWRECRLFEVEVDLHGAGLAFVILLGVPHFSFRPFVLQGFKAVARECAVFSGGAFPPRLREGSARVRPPCGAIFPSPEARGAEASASPVGSAITSPLPKTPSSSFVGWPKGCTHQERLSREPLAISAARPSPWTNELEEGGKSAPPSLTSEARFCLRAKLPPSPVFSCLLIF